MDVIAAVAAAQHADHGCAVATVPPQRARQRPRRASGRRCCGPCRGKRGAVSSMLFADTHGVQVVHCEDLPHVRGVCVCGKCKHILRRHFFLGDQPHVKCKTAPSRRCEVMLQSWFYEVTLPSGTVVKQCVRFDVTTARELHARITAKLAHTAAAVPLTQQLVTERKESGACEQQEPAAAHDKFDGCWGPCRQRQCHRTESLLFHHTHGVQAIDAGDQPFLLPRTVCMQCKLMLLRHFSLDSSGRSHRGCFQRPREACVKKLSRCRLVVTLPSGEKEWRPVRFVFTCAQQLHTRMAAAAVPPMAPNRLPPVLYNNKRAREDGNTSPVPLPEVHQTKRRRRVAADNNGPVARISMLLVAAQCVRRYRGRLPAAS